MPFDGNQKQQRRILGNRQRHYDEAAKIDRETRGIINTRMAQANEGPRSLDFATGDIPRYEQPPTAFQFHEIPSSKKMSFIELMLRIIMALPNPVPSKMGANIDFIKRDSISTELRSAPQRSPEFPNYAFESRPSQEAFPKVKSTPKSPKDLSISQQRTLVTNGIKDFFESSPALEKEALDVVAQMPPEDLEPFVEGILKEGDDFLPSLKAELDATQKVDSTQDVEKEMRRAVPYATSTSSTATLSSTILPSTTLPSTTSSTHFVNSIYNQGVTTQEFGFYKDSNGAEYFFPGTNILLSPEQALYNNDKVGAFFEGTVIATGFNENLGNVVIVQNSDGRAFAYGYLSSFSVWRGQNLVFGEEFGSVGLVKNDDSNGNILHVQLLTPEFAQRISQAADNEAAMSIFSNANPRYGRENPRNIFDLQQVAGEVGDVVHIGQEGIGQASYNASKIYTYKDVDPVIVANPNPNDIDSSLSVWPQGIASTSQDQLRSVSDDGVIVVGEGRVAMFPNSDGSRNMFGRILTGNAIPLVDDTGATIPNYYTLDGHILHLQQTGNSTYDLIITAPSAEYSNNDNSVRIKNFNPNPQSYNWGITLDAVRDLQAPLVYKNFTVSTDFAMTSEGIGPTANSLIPSVDPRGMFSFIHLGSFSDRTNSITIEQATILGGGEGVNSTTLVKDPNGYVEPAPSIIKMPDGNYAYAWADHSDYPVQNEVKLQLAIIDNTGNLARTIDVGSYLTASNTTNVSIGVDNSGNCFCAYNIDGTKYCAQFDSETVDEPQAVTTVPQAVPQDHTSAQLSTGHVVTLVYTATGEHHHPTFSMQMPQLARANTTEVADYIFSQEEFLYNANLPDDSVTIAPNSDGVINVKKMPGGILMINNYHDSSVKINLAGFGIDASYLAANIHPITDIFPPQYAQNLDAVVNPSMQSDYNVGMPFNWTAPQYSFSPNASGFAPQMDMSANPTTFDYDSISGAASYLLLPDNQVLFFTDTQAGELSMISQSFTFDDIPARRFLGVFNASSKDVSRDQTSTVATVSSTNRPTASSSTIFSSTNLPMTTGSASASKSTSSQQQSSFAPTSAVPSSVRTSGSAASFSSTTFPTSRPTEKTSTATFTSSKPTERSTGGTFSSTDTPHREQPDDKSSEGGVNVGEIVGPLAAVVAAGALICVLIKRLRKRRQMVHNIEDQFVNPAYELGEIQHSPGFDQAWEGNSLPKTTPSIGGRKEPAIVVEEINSNGNSLV